MICSDQAASEAMTAVSRPGPPEPDSNSICLLSGPLKEFLLYSCQENSQWLIDMAHDLCDPAKKRGSLKVQNATGQAWENVIPTNPLTSSIYIYDIQAVVSLTKMSRRNGKSISSSSGNASTVQNHVIQRDGQCWVTGLIYPVINSHMCPKRMGDHLLRVIYRNFVSTHDPDSASLVSIHDEICGITLHLAPDAFFDTYELGLRLVAPVRSSHFLIFYSNH
jgi:hypothetical protein